MARGRQVDDRIREMIARAYQETTVQVREILHEFDITAPTLYRILDEFGIPRRGAGSQRLSNRLTDTEIEDILTRYAQKEPVIDICRLYRIDAVAFYGLLNDLGMSPRTHSKEYLQDRKAQLDNAVRMYEEGWVIWFIEMETGVAQYQLYKELRRRGVELRGKGIGGLIPDKDEDGNYIHASVDGRTSEDFQKRISESISDMRSRQESE